MTAEFPAHVPYDVIEKLAREWQFVAPQTATVTHGQVAPLDGASPRRVIQWKVDCADLRNTTSDGVFEAQVMAAAERGIRLERRIRELTQDGGPGEKATPPCSGREGEEVC